MGGRLTNVHIEEDHTDELLAALGDSIEQILTRWGELAEGYAKMDCPVDTGNLRNSITYEVEMAEQAVYVGSDVEYAPYVELGTSRMAARPFLKPAIVNHEQEYKNIMDECINSA